MNIILIIEDDPAILRGLTDILSFEGYKVFSANDGESGYHLAKTENPELIVLDLMLPNLSGYEICRKLRTEGLSTPIIMLTARGQETERILGLDLGADDYITKPFSVRELLARVRALLRRAQTAKPAKILPDIIRFNDVVVDFKKCEASKGALRIDLTRKEFGLLRLLASRSSEVITRDDLLNEVWGYDNYPTTRTVDSHIATLRAKIEADPTAPRHLITVHGIGYKFVP